MANALTGQGVYIFNYILGGQIPLTNRRASPADTNMPGAGQLPMGHQMLVYALQAIPDEFPGNIAGGLGVINPLFIDPATTIAGAYWKWRKIFHQTMLHLVVEQTKAFVEGPLAHFPAGGGLVMDNSEVGPGEVQAGYDIHNGERSWEATRRLAMPVHLGSLENFYVQLDWPRGGIGHDQSGYLIQSGFGITIRLTGPRQRPTG